jgi:uncharacterized protein YukE
MLEMKTLRSLVSVSALAAVLWIAASAAAQAQYAPGTLSDAAYEEMQRLAQDLDDQAMHANDQAEHDQYRIYGRDTGFVRAVANFARRASLFNDRMANYRTRPWQVDAELRQLLQSAKNVQLRVQRSRYVDNHTVADWNETVTVLNRMIRLYQADVNGTGRYDYGTRPQAPVYRDVPPPAYRPGYPPPYGGAHSPNAYVYSQERLAALAHELEDRATRAHELAERLAASNGPRQQEFLEAIHHFNEQSAAFHQRVEHGMSDPAQIRAEVNHLLDDARQADQGMRQTNVFPEVWQEWRGAMQVLERILALVGG